MKTTRILSLVAVAAAMTFTSCKTEDEVTKNEYTDVYFMDAYNEDIEKIAIGGGTSSVVSEGIYGSGIAYDKKNVKIYYSDFANDSTPDGKIWRADLNGGNAVAIASGIQDPYGIAIDADNGKIYWGDDNGNVSRCNLDGTGKQDIVTIDGGGIRAVAIDQTNDKLYFYDVQHNSLYKANLDGTSATVIIEGYYGYAIAIDEKNSKIYFDAQTDDETVSALYYANLDGSSPTLVDDTQSRIYGIAIDNENSKVYWSGRDTYEIYKANLNGTEKVTLNTEELGSPRGIFLKY